MIKRQIVAFFAISPILLLTSDSVICALLGVLYFVVLSTIIQETESGRHFLRALYRDALRLENWLAGQVR